MAALGFALALKPLRNLCLFLLLAGVLAVEQEEWIVHCSSDCGGFDSCNDRRLCSGDEVETMICDEQDRQPCGNNTDHCEPQDCIMEEWSGWRVEKANGLCNRTRTFVPNSCGGKPCLGRTAETKFCPPSDTPLLQDCEFSNWASWEKCDTDLGQRTRARVILKIPKNGGIACEGKLESTEPCGNATMPVDCELSDWMMWSGCSKQCGGGQKTRLRSIIQKASKGGKPCGDETGGTMVLQETEGCNWQNCSIVNYPVDCVVGSWNEWSDCGGGQSQIYRSRDVATPAAYGGKPCIEVLHETAPCGHKLVPMAKKVDCVLNEWEQWSLCDRTCAGGQTFRKRSVHVPSQNGGTPCQEATMETAACNEIACNSGGEEDLNCQLSAWEMWSGCSSACGQGVQQRTRIVEVEAEPGGFGCSADLTEVRPCADYAPCDTRDCEWGGWTNWGPCSASCGKGNHKRSRKVITPPSAGGKPCEPVGSTEEVEECEDAPCTEDCVDGAWDAWSAWGPCTRSCGGGARWRHRDVILEASPCGRPPLGNSTAVESCGQDPCEGENANCLLEQWTLWSSCSTSCEGVQTRKRDIAIFGRGAGLSCTSEALSELRSCNGPDSMAVDREICGFGETVDCELGEWGEWSGCSKECDGGQRDRERDVKRPATNGGELCNGALKESEQCGTQPCTPSEDCVWGEWSDWGTCTRCDGEKTRTRVIKHFANAGGRPCQGDESKQIAPCIGGVSCNPKFYCVWSEWGDASTCSAECGAATKKRSRSLRSVKDEPKNKTDIVAVVDVAAKCTGVVAMSNGYDAGFQYEDVQCEGLPDCNPCVPINCELSEWSQWSVDSSCTGLCSRSRSVMAAPNRCGTNCSETLDESKECEMSKCDGTQNCTFSEWTEWVGCGSGKGQQYRSREIAKPPGSLGGLCIGTLNETKACGEATEAQVDCLVHEWSEWTPCDKTCGGGQQHSTRDVATPASGGGEGCTANITRVQPCNDHKCPADSAVDCELAAWLDWEGCENPTDIQAIRMRTLAREAEQGGYPCSGALKETGFCPMYLPEDCVMGTWDQWGDCDVSCGGGQRMRTRETSTEAGPRGKPCSGTIQETTPCAMDPCDGDKDCKLDMWAEWSDCSATCGQGHQIRERGIARAAKPGGAGCTSQLKEVQACSLSACGKSQDCELHEWSDWSECFPALYCGIGHRKRTRSIKVAPADGGKPCEASTLEELVPSVSCPGQCEAGCTESEWAKWGEWGACSATCDAGVRTRTRTVSLEAGGTTCGPPAKGLASDYQSCQVAHACATAVAGASDCGYTKWSESDCSAKCHGFRVKARNITKGAANGGKPCHGALMEAIPCNPGHGELAPAGCGTQGIPVDCQVEEWENWGSCSATCGIGHRSRSRSVVAAPMYGGRGCPSPLREVHMCHLNKCPVGPDNDCQWGDWQQWGVCDPIRGEQSRLREVAMDKFKDGKDCLGEAKQVKKCQAACVDRPHACKKSDWSAWSACTATCGVKGRKTRKRSLVLGPPQEEVTTTPLPMVEIVLATASPLPVTGKFDADAAVDDAESHHVATATRETQLATAFACGCLSIAVVTGFARAFRSMGSSRIGAAASLDASMSSRRGLRAAVATEELLRNDDLELQ